MPAVSVVMATYNRSEALAIAVRSALSQTLTDIEVLVVGDGCTDESEAVVRSIGDDRLRWINLDRNHGSQWKANNTGVAIAGGELIAYHGHDDVWHPRHLEFLRETLERHDIAASVMLSYAPPETGVMLVSGAFLDGVYRPSEFLPPTSLAHTRAVFDGIGG